MTDELIKLVTIADTAIGLAREPGDVVRIAIAGHLLNGNRAEFKQLVVDQIERGDRTFVLDLTRCGYIDSSALGALVSVDRKIHAAGGTLRCVGLNPDLVTLFELTKLNLFMTIEPAPETTNG